jgi:DNA-binding transcriptional regulator YiaG
LIKEDAMVKIVKNYQTFLNALNLTDSKESYRAFCEHYCFDPLGIKAAGIKEQYVNANYPARYQEVVIKAQVREKMTYREIRAISNMTQQSYADYFGIPKRTIENWDAEKNTPPRYVIDLMEYKLRKENIIK